MLILETLTKEDNNNLDPPIDMLKVCLIPRIRAKLKSSVKNTFKKKTKSNKQKKSAVENKTIFITISFTDKGTVTNPVNEDDIPLSELRKKFIKERKEKRRLGIQNVERKFVKKMRKSMKASLQLMEDPNDKQKYLSSTTISAKLAKKN